MELHDRPSLDVRHQRSRQFAGEICLSRSRRAVEDDLALFFEQRNDVIDEFPIDEKLFGQVIERIRLGFWGRTRVALREPIEE